MRSLDSPEVRIRYSTSIVDLSDPYFQILVLRHRMAPTIEDRKRLPLAQWAIMLMCYGIGTAVMTLFALLGAIHWAVFSSYQIPMALVGVILIVEIAVCVELAYKVLRHDLIFPVKQIGLSCDGIRTLRSFMSGAEKTFMRWSDVSSVRVKMMECLDYRADVYARGNSLLTAKTKLEPCIELLDVKNRSIKLRLSAIRSIEERKVLVEMIKKFARLTTDKDDIAQILRVNQIQDIAFTQLWSNALKSTVPRRADSKLADAALLQDGRFLIKKQIGGGGQGAIYIAEMLESTGETKEIALKEYVLPDLEHVFDRKRAVDQFEREVHLLTRLDHKAVVKLLDAFVEDHRAYLVMELLHGESIKQMVKRRGALPQAEVIELTMKLCDVLKYLHSFEPQIVHLDVTPDNIIVQEDGELKLLDFNTSSDGSGLRTKLIAGKQKYMSPEQFRNEVSPSCDIYALGCTMFFMLTGVEPEPLTRCRVEDFRQNVDAALSQCIEQATELEGTLRLQSVDALKQALSPREVTV